MKILLPILILFLSFNSVSSASYYEEQDYAAYEFSEHLGEADAMILKRVRPEDGSGPSRMERYYGKWKSNQFEFADLENEAPIRFGSGKFNGVEKEGIELATSDNMLKIIQFYDVEAGSKLVINYGIDDEFTREEADSTIYLSVWIGQHKLTRIIIPNEPGWHSRIIDLGVAAFLKRSVVLTFEAVADSNSVRKLVVLPEIHK